MKKRRVAIIGGGFTGLAAAFDLARDGRFDVTILEKDRELGGLAGTFYLEDGIRLEKFYHHWFTSDRSILGLIEELGLQSNLKYIKSNTGLFFANSIFRLTSPLDLLRFPAIPFLDRVKTGLMALRARRIDDWSRLENQSAEDWIKENGGERAFEVIWKPLLYGKFGEEAPNVSAVWFWNKLKLRGSSRDKKGKESLVYFQGGFGAFTDALHQKLSSMGVSIHTNTEVKKILTADGGVSGLETAQGQISADIVLGTVPLPVFLDMAPFLNQDITVGARQVRFLGNVCLVLRLNRSLSKTYWLNVADPSFPFVGIIEHTNFDSLNNYGGEHIAYISKYLPVSDPLFKLSDAELFEYCYPFIQRIFPEFTIDWVNKFHVWRAHYSQPVIVKNYSALIPPMKLPTRNLWLSTMAQIYPEDRGTNYAIREGRRVAHQIISSLA